MGAGCVQLFVFSFSCLLRCIDVYPIEEKGYSRNDEFAVQQTFTGWSLSLAFAFTVSCILLVVGCLNCCRQRAGFKEFRNSVSEANVDNVGLDLVNPTENVAVQPSAYSIFSSLNQTTNVDRQADSIVTFEPLPRVLPNTGKTRDTSFIENWLVDKDFPRQQLHYLRECGQGWFGKVVEGEARGILQSSNKVCRVVVRILKEDASATEQALFLQEAKPFRDLSHPNVLKLLGKCLDNVPFLLVFETCSNGDLKSFLKLNVVNKNALVYQGVLLRMAVDVASGLSYMLQNGFVHTDIAARNCLVTSDLRIKVGDYGTNLQAYREEYYCNGDIALPIRWCAPETLNCTDTTIEPKQVIGASCIWSFGVLLWELEEWGKLPYKDLTDEQVINRVFGVEGLRLSYPINRTPYTREIYDIMTECWKDYIDRPSFIHVMNSLSALLHRFKSNDFDARWYSSKPNSIPIADNEDKSENRGRDDSDSGIDFENPKLKRSDFSLLQLQQSVSRQRLANDDFSSESPSSSRRFSNSSTGNIFSSSTSMKVRSPSLENLHGSVGSLNRRIIGDDVFENTEHSSSVAKVDFRLGLVSSEGGDNSILWNNKPLFQSDNYLEENSIIKRVDLMSTDAEEEIWRKRIERGEFTEKVKEKSKSVADLMVLTHIDCSESSESDSLPSFHSRQSSFNRQCRRMSCKSNAPLSLLNSLSFGSESNLPVVEKDQEFQETLKKIQIAKISGNEDSVNLVSLQTNNLASGMEDKDRRTVHFLANEASEKHTNSSHNIEYALCNGVGESKIKLPVPLFDFNLFQSANAKDTLDKTQTEPDAESANINSTSTMENQLEKQILNEHESSYSQTEEILLSNVHVRESLFIKDEKHGSSRDIESVVIGPSEMHTLEYFKGLTTVLVEKFDEYDPLTNQPLENPQSLTDFPNDAGEDYFYKYTSNEVHLEELPCEHYECRPLYCDFCYSRCHFSNECLRFRDISNDDKCSCGALNTLELNSCLFQSDDSGRGTDQVNSGDGSSDKSLEGSISVQMNEVKNRLEDVIAKFTVRDDASDNNCFSSDNDKDFSYEDVVEELEADGAEDESKNTAPVIVEVQNSEDSPEKRMLKEISVDKDTFIGNSNLETFSNYQTVEHRENDDDRLVDSKLQEVAEVVSNQLCDLFPSSAVSMGEEHREFCEVHPETENAISYEISDILEGLSEPVSLLYSVNEVDNSKKISSNWLPMPIDDHEDDRKRSLTMDESFVEAIRNELMEKLQSSSTLAFGESECEVKETPTENANVLMEYTSYPTHLSPILEEEDEEEEYSWLSSVKSTVSTDNSTSETINDSRSQTFEKDDILIVDTETHAVSFLESELFQLSSSKHKLNETYEVDENDDTIGASDPLDSDSVVTPDSLSPCTSSKTGTPLSYSSSEYGNLSDVFLSPSSSRNLDDLDVCRSPDDSRLLNLSENISSPSKTNYQRTMLNIEEMLKRSEEGRDLIRTNSSVPLEKRLDSQQHAWLRSYFNSANEVTSLDSFDMSGDDEAEFRSLPADFKSECWPAVNELVRPNLLLVDDDEETNGRDGVDTSKYTSDDCGTDTVTNSPTDYFLEKNGETIFSQERDVDTESDESDVGAGSTPMAEIVAKTQTVELQKSEMAEKVYVSENEASSSENSQSISSKPSGASCSVSGALEEASSNFASQNAKLKNSIALFGNGMKKIRNFQVSVVEDDSLFSNRGSSRVRPVESYWLERFAESSSEDSKKTWKSLTFGAHVTSPNLEVPINDGKDVHPDSMLMSTSFIESEGQEHARSKSNEDEVESRSEEVVCKENDGRDININMDEEKDKSEYEDEDEGEDEDDEELAEFVPFSWNSNAVPKKSSLRAKDKIVVNKKNVSFKKQKYHCVYEYPKEDLNYARIYDNMLQERMLSLWNVDRDYMYNDYSSFLDWELDECNDEQQSHNDDFIPFDATIQPASRVNIPSKLGLLDTTGLDDSSPDNMPHGNTKSSLVPPYMAVSPEILSTTDKCAEEVEVEQDESKHSATVKKSEVEENTAISSVVDQEICDTLKDNISDTSSTLALGELKHTKNRLKLDLQNSITLYKSSTKKSKLKMCAEDNDMNSPPMRVSTELLEDRGNFVQVSDYSGLNYKPCDISPVVELKSLTSTSVA